MGFTENLNLAVLLVFTSALLTSSVPVPDSSPGGLPSSDVAELARINQKSFSIRLPAYKIHENGTAELLEEAAGGRLVCETSYASPYVWDTYMAASQISSNGWCQQRNPVGSKCTSHSRYATAALSVCGTWMMAVRCNELAWVGGLVADHCRWGGRAGGQYFYDDSPGLLKGVVHWNDV